VQTLIDEIALDLHVQEDPIAKEILCRMVEVLDATLRTNLFMEDRYALTLRLSPELFEPGKFDRTFGALGGSAQIGDGAEAVTVAAAAAAAAASSSERSAGECGGRSGSNGAPYGVFYVHGRHFNAFHVRFSDIARGSMRLVVPESAEQFAIESARHFDEAYQLAAAQEQKNKDVPEGGAIAVILLDLTKTMEQKDYSDKKFVLRKTVKAFADAMLDLITPDSHGQVVDLLGKDELIYLGPDDERVNSADIDWMTWRAK